MVEIDFTCSKCGQWLGAPADTAGLLVECPACRATVTVPERSVVPQVTQSARPADTGSKSETVRIELPPNLGLPPAAPPRRIIIRRSS